MKREEKKDRDEKGKREEEKRGMKSKYGKYILL